MAEHQSTVVVGDDTDLLVLLCRHAPPVGPKLYFRPEPKLNSWVPPRCWDIRNLQLSLGPQYKSILFIRAASRIYGVGNAMALKLMKMSVHFQQQSAIFNSSATKKEDIKAGEQTITSLYRG